MPKDTGKNFENIVKEFYPDLSLKEVEDKLYFIFSRRSCRKFNPDIVVPDNILSMIIHAGMFAPNSGNIQNWDFLVLKQKDEKEKAASFCYNQRFLIDASVLIVVLTDFKEGKNFFRDKGELFSIINGAMASENMLLTANILNVGSVFSAVSDEEGLKDSFNIPGHVKVLGVVALGYCAETPSFNDRKKAAEVVYLHKYGLRFEDIDLVLYNPRIFERLKKYSSTTIPALKEEILEKASKYKFELLHKELLLKNRQIKSLKEELEKMHKSLILKTKKEGPWSYYILKKVKGLEYPIKEKDKNLLYEKLKDVNVKNIPFKIIFENLEFPINNHKELLKKIRKVLEKLNVVEEKKKKENKEKINEFNENDSFIFINSFEDAYKKLLYYSKKNDSNILLYFNTKKDFLKYKNKIIKSFGFDKKEFEELYEKGVIEKKVNNKKVKFYFKTVRNYKDKSTKNVVFTLKDLIQKIDFKVHNKIIVLE